MVISQVHCNAVLSRRIHPQAVYCIHGLHGTIRHHRLTDVVPAASYSDGRQSSPHHNRTCNHVKQN